MRARRIRRVMTAGAGLALGTDGGAIETATADGPVTRSSLTDVELIGGGRPEPEMTPASSFIVGFALLALIGGLVFMQRRSRDQ